MNFLFLKITLTFFGGLFFWIVKGFKTALKHELKDKYFLRNIFASILVYVLIITFFINRKKENIPFSSGEDVKQTFENIIKKIVADTIKKEQHIPVFPSNP